MKFFIDTANVDEITEAAKMGILDGVTTNPSLMSKEIQRTGERAENILKKICQIVQGPVSAEVVGLDADTMESEYFRYDGRRYQLQYVHEEYSDIQFPPLYH